MKRSNFKAKFYFHVLNFVFFDHFSIEIEETEWKYKKRWTRAFEWNCCSDFMIATFTRTLTHILYWLVILARISFSNLAHKFQSAFFSIDYISVGKKWKRMKKICDQSYTQIWKQWIDEWMHVTESDSTVTHKTDRMWLRLQTNIGKINERNTIIKTRIESMYLVFISSQRRWHLLAKSGAKTNKTA